jgi:hypothetical protein
VLGCCPHCTDRGTSKVRIFAEPEAPTVVVTEMLAEELGPPLQATHPTNMAAVSAASVHRFVGVVFIGQSSFPSSGDARGR